MANVETVIAAANTLFQTVPGVKRVFQQAPDQAPSADLPCVVPVLSSFQHSAQANGYQRKDYVIKFHLLVRPYSGSLVTVEKEARPYGDAVVDLFFPHVKLGDEAIDHAAIVQADYGEIPYNSQQIYVGWTFTLNATIKQTIAQGV